MVKLTKHETARQTITETLYSVSSYEVLSIGFLMKEYGEDAYIYVVDESYGGHDTDLVIYIKRDRLETDDEYNARMEKLLAVKQMVGDNKKKDKQKKETSERAEYERLRKKFEK